MASIERLTVIFGPEHSIRFWPVPFAIHNNPRLFGYFAAFLKLLPGEVFGGRRSRPFLRSSQQSSGALS